MRRVKLMNIVLLIFLLSIPFSLGAIPCWGQATVNPDSLFYEANTLYAKNNFGAAVQKYEELIRLGYQSGNLYFNLGNAYFKAGKKGMAVLYYEKARRMMPWDADLKANLSYAGAQNGLDRGIHGLGYLLTINQTMINASVWFFILMALYIAWILWPVKLRVEGEKRLKQWSRVSVWVLGCLFVFSLVIAGMTVSEQTQPAAVVIGRGSAVRFEPNPHGTEYYRLGEGSVVRILDKKDGWIMVQRADHKRGWIPGNEIRTI